MEMIELGFIFLCIAFILIATTNTTFATIRVLHEEPKQPCKICLMFTGILFSFMGAIMVSEQFDLLVEFVKNTMDYSSLILVGGGILMTLLNFINNKFVKSAVEYDTNSKNIYRTESIILTIGITILLILGTTMFLLKY